MADLLQVRRDTAANWTSNDPTLAAGEFGFETDTGLLKVGDGSTAWTSLDYVGGAAGTVQKVEIDRITDPVSGEFDFTSLSLSSYDQVIISGTLASDRANTVDDVLVQINGDTTTTNYFYQRNLSREGSGLDSEGNSNFLSVCSAANAPANSESSVDITIKNPSATVPTTIVNTVGAYGSSNATAYVGTVCTNHNTAAAVTGIKLLSANAADLTGTLILYGEKTIA